ncbi:dienelactone hydrolase family protein [Pseudomonas citronellolis]|uniref:dienelactone hydrolase family protein n=1 Tax=Pseudomonas citronellolis TaxID=53408 RepID=UPI0023E41167|nr:dienelactone hydrolase family protein [Pseudomonas citronellolis]MDF3931525.1 dienelactone hydrolase family protein [Pseudomonas citronellolis]
MDDPLSGFLHFDFDDGHYQHPVYFKGEGPRVIVMHELPGLAPATFGFAERLVEAGFNVHLPLLFGEVLDDSAPLNYARLCVSKEFARLKSGVSAPVCDWLRALARHLGEAGDQRRIGVIGMCVTGAFVIPMIIESTVGVGVVSQPAVPFSLPYRLTGLAEGAWMEEMNIADADLNTAVNVVQAQDKRLIVQRFSDDRLCPHARVRRIAQAFGANAQLNEYPTVPPSPDHPHALMTAEFDRVEEPPERPGHPTRQALQSVVEFLRGHLV